MKIHFSFLVSSPVSLIDETGGSFSFFLEPGSENVEPDSSSESTKILVSHIKNKNHSSGDS